MPWASTDLTSLNKPDPSPKTGSELVASASFSAPALSGLDVVTYRGAFEPQKPMSAQWTAGWTNFDPKNTNYRAIKAKGQAIIGPGLNSGRTRIILRPTGHLQRIHSTCSPDWCTWIRHTR